METLLYQQPFVTETGFVFPNLEIAYDTYGTLNRGADNVIWVCHAFTADSDVRSWWPGMVGPGLLFDTDKYFVVCANILGSCYGTTGPASINPATGKPWLRDFPLITFRDVVNVHEILRKHLGINRIHVITGASIGGSQAMEYSVMFPDLVERLILLESSVRQTPWALAFNESMRLAMEADQTFLSGEPDGGKRGLKAARSIAMISYRTSYAYNLTQKEDDDEKLTSFRAASYQAYQGEKLVKRYNPYSYWCMTQLADTHNIGRKRGGVLNALKMIKAHTLSIGVRSDYLYPVEEQKFIAANTPGGVYAEIDSFFGHDGFLVETEAVSGIMKEFMATPGKH